MSLEADIALYFRKNIIAMFRYITLKTISTLPLVLLATIGPPTFSKLKFELIEVITISPL
jgi:hypothetical protein